MTLRARSHPAASALLGLAFAAGCGETDPAGDPATPPVAASTRLMADRLAALDDPADFERQVAALDSTPRPGDLRGTLLYAARRANLLTQAGRLEEAADEFRRMRATIDQWSQRVPAEFKRDMAELEAMVLLWGAVQNACLRDAEACLFPLRSEPFADDPRPARAFDTYRGLLETGSQSLLSAWLLNVSAMAAGRYPDGVPEEWRIPPEAFESEADIGRFTNRAAELGVDAPGRAGGSVMEDFDGDGDLDLMASSLYLTDEIRLFLNEGGRFVDAGHERGLAGLTGGLNLVQADYDDDGDVDVFVLRGGWNRLGQPNSLIRNEGDARFTDVTQEAGVFSSHPTQTASWVDYDGDGDLDLFIGNESETRGRVPRIAPAELYRNEGDGTFVDVAADVGLDVVGFIKAVAWGDYDDDGRPDVYLSRFDEPNQLFRNEGPTPEGGWRFTDVTATAGVAEPRESFPTWFWDYDHDGRLDLFVSGYRLRPGDIPAEYLGNPGQGALPRLYRNRGDGSFEDVTAAAGLERVLYTMGSNYGDLDNDGWPDFYAGTGEPNLRAIVPNRMFRNAGGRFEDVTTSGGFGHVAKGHGVAFGDLDGDGDQDLYVVLGGAVQADVGRNALWENPGHGNRWITLRLEGVEANRSAVGARVRVGVDTPSGTRDIYVLAGSGGSFGASSLQQEIGLGDATAIREIEVRWPGSGVVERIDGPPLDAVYRLREGSGRLERVEAAPVPLGGPER